MGSLLGVGRSRIVPEFSFLDPRGLGALEGYSLQEAAEQLNNGDRQSPNWKPLRNYDGAMPWHSDTPNHTCQSLCCSVVQAHEAINQCVFVSQSTREQSSAQLRVCATMACRHTK